MRELRARACRSATSGLDLIRGTAEAAMIPLNDRPQSVRRLDARATDPSDHVRSLSRPPRGAAEWEPRCLDGRTRERVPRRHRSGERGPGDRPDRRSDGRLGRVDGAAPNGHPVRAVWPLAPRPVSGRPGLPRAGRGERDGAAPDGARYRRGGRSRRRDAWAARLTSGCSVCLIRYDASCSARMTPLRRLRPHRRPARGRHGHVCGSASSPCSWAVDPSRGAVLNVAVSSFKLAKCFDVRVVASSVVVVHGSSAPLGVTGPVSVPAPRVETARRSHLARRDTNPHSGGA